MEQDKMKNQTCKNCGHENFNHELYNGECIKEYCPCKKFEAEKLALHSDESLSLQSKKPQKGSKFDLSDKIVKRKDMSNTFLDEKYLHVTKVKEFIRINLNDISEVMHILEDLGCIHQELYDFRDRFRKRAGKELS